ncbi:hypothetical protein GGR56DRAFT_678307 [Xylariaceae sp. FL0804]|nr:hypothetical protein GGR56DRAFT_678307 [Xylariaceae sp. FL0804]
MQFTLATLLVALAASANAAAIESRQNDGRPNSFGACCAAGQSLKEDFCTDASGQSGLCVPADTAGCDAALTCIAMDLLTCDDNTLENGRPTCRLSSGY